jgi:hypothetical protein
VRRTFSIFLLTVAACGQLYAEVSSATTIVGVKLLKKVLGQTAPSPYIHLPSDCPACELMHGDFYQGQNAHEVFLYLKVPVDRSVLRGVRVDVGNLAVRAVIVEKEYLHFSRNGNTLEFDVPVDPKPRSSTVELQTNLHWPGIVLRIEHAFEDRRAGAYAEGRWPALERSAALNLEFGMREALRSLHLDSELTARLLGTIHLMGFDTNYPLGHGDNPPHIHLILRWPHYAGSQAPHFYIGPDGLLVNTKITVDGLPFLKTTDVPRGKAIPVVDYLGETLFYNSVTNEGYLEIRLPDGKSTCRLQPPVGATDGFASGTVVRCTNLPEQKIQATDDTLLGEVRAMISSASGTQIERYRYDPDTATLLSAEPALPNTK